MSSKAKQITPIKKYMKEIKKKFLEGGSTEHSYRGDLQVLLSELFPEVSVINEPKRQEFGSPDYVIKKGDVPVGYIEAKDIGADLNKTEKT